LQKEAELKVTGNGLAKATTEAEALAALGKKVSRYTPHPLPPGAMFLQPTEERRRSGSHYTPRSLVAPIVATTGVLIRDRHFAGQLRQQFDGLVQSQQVRRLRGF
jgi:hypothetical protein